MYMRLFYLIALLVGLECIEIGIRLGCKQRTILTLHRVLNGTWGILTSYLWLFRCGLVRYVESYLLALS